MQRARDGILGALIGDALGVPHEFKCAAQIPVATEITMVLPSSYRKTYPHIPYGTWSDDGSQLLCLLESLACHDGCLVPDDFARLLVAWRDKGWHQSGGTVFDCGGQTDKALDRWRGGLPVEVTERGQGNGSLMRALPAALLPCLWGLNREDAIAVAMEQSAVTHPHPVAMVCCAVYAQIALLWMDNTEIPVTDAVASAFILVGQDPSLAAPELQAAVRTVEVFGTKEMPTGSGHVVNSFWSAVWALRQGHDYQSAVQASISLGNDADTTACIAGGLAGIRWGLDTVSPAWRAALGVPVESSKLFQDIFGVGALG